MDHLLWCCLTSLLLNYAAASTEENRELGKGFYLPDKNLFEYTFLGGYNIFTNLPSDECFQQASVQMSYNYTENYEDLIEFYNGVEVSLGLPKIGVPNYFTLAPSLARLSIGEKTQLVSGSSLNVKSIRDKWTLTANCINTKELSKEMVDDFNNLPESIDHPESLSSWYKYSVFLEKYGSHVAVGIEYGSQLIQWEVMHASSEATAKTLQAKACIDLYGCDALKGGKSEGVSDKCTGLDKKIVKKAQSVSSEKVLIVRGGPTELQGKMHKKTRTIDQIERFIAEGHGKEAGPIVYEWKPIYTILKRQLRDDSSEHKIINLEMFYKGMLSYGCTLLSPGGGLKLRKFVKTSGVAEKPTYECQVLSTGCLKDSDCHRQWLVGCYCYGSSCIDELLLKAGEKKDRQIRKKKEGSAFAGVNRSCKWSWGRCKCKNKSTWETVWSSDQYKDEEDDAVTEEDTEGDYSGTAGSVDDQEYRHNNDRDRDRA